MKKEIHPNYKKVTIKCACGNSIETKSTVAPEMHVELCSACHPFFTGKQKFVDTAGRVDKFRARMEAAKSVDKKKTTKENISSEKKSEPSNLDKLTEIKKEIRKKPEFAVGQEITSETEAAAASELTDPSKSKSKDKNN